MFVVGNNPLESAGIRLEQSPSMETAIKEAGLDFHVSKRQLILPNQNEIYESGDVINTRGKVIDMFATVRDDTLDVLGYVGSKYRVYQNLEAFEQFDIAREFGYEYFAAGIIANGSKSWIAMKHPDGGNSIDASDDKVEKYLLFYNSHDGTIPISLRITPIRLLCGNMLNLALSKSYAKITSLHTENMQKRIAQATKLLKQVEGQYELVYEYMQKMAEQKFHANQAHAYFEKVIPGLKKRDDKSLKRNSWKPQWDNIVNNYYHGPGNYGQSLWHAYNAITQFVDYDKYGHRNASDWMERTQFMTGDTIKRKAFQTAVGVVEGEVSLN